MEKTIEIGRQYSDADSAEVRAQYYASGASASERRKIITEEEYAELEKRGEEMSKYRTVKEHQALLRRLDAEEFKRKRESRDRQTKED